MRCPARAKIPVPGSAGQRRLQTVLAGLSVLWVGVHGDPLAAARREAHRPGRIPGMAVTQAAAVHTGVRYDVEVDTTNCSALACAHRIARSAAG